MSVMTHWYSLSEEEVLEKLGSKVTGISEAEAERRRERFGFNKLKLGKKKNFLFFFFEQFKNFLAVILIFAILLSVLAGEYTEGLVILLILLLAALLGAMQNYRAERVMAELEKMAPEFARVLREGKEHQVLVEDLVPGDIILLSAGDKVPADAYLLEEVNLKVDESILTGESIPVEKEVGVLPPAAPFYARKNILFGGTSVVYGKGKAVVCETGMNTELGKIAQSLERIEEEKTPLQLSIEKLGKWFGVVTLIICAVIGGIGIFRGEKILDMLIWAIALAVAIVPEALPAVMTIALSLGTKRMAKRNGLVRRLASVETLGAINVIGTDKTGTITKGEMAVKEVFLAKGKTKVAVSGVGYEPKGEFIMEGKGENLSVEDLNRLLLVSVLCNDSRLKKERGRWTIDGDPTEGALLVLAAKKGVEREEIEKKYPRLDEIPFSPERKLMTTIHRNGEKIFIATKGAGEIVLSKSVLEEKEREDLLEVMREMANRGLRVLGIAYREAEGIISDEEVEDGLKFLGFVGMMDLPRPEVKEAVKKCREAKIKPVVITGDHLLTAKAVAKEIGIFEERERAITGEELEQMTDEELEREIDKIAVIARVSPFHKLRIVEAFQKKGYVVAMTGDGVNDALALKKADIGVAMGVTGTQVTKEVADLIILDDNFATIVHSIEEGRNIFKNMKNFIGYALSLHLGEILLITLSLLLKLPLPLTAAQILWINLVTDGLPPIALSLEPLEPGLMSLPPRQKSESFFTRNVIRMGLFTGCLIALQAIFLFFFGSPKLNLNRAQTLVFAMVTVSAMFNVFNWRSERVSVFKIGLFKNWPLILAILSTLLLLLAVIYLPGLSTLFATFSLTLSDWLLIGLLGSTTLLFGELMKLIEK